MNNRINGQKKVKLVHTVLVLLNVPQKTGTFRVYESSSLK